VCNAPECGGQHAIWLHELLKDTPGKEGQVHMVQGEAGWRTPEEAWMEDKREEEEEVMFVNMVQGEEVDTEEDGKEREDRLRRRPRRRNWRTKSRGRKLLLTSVTDGELSGLE
jgi:hypothetical protein